MGVGFNTTALTYCISLGVAGALLIHSLPTFKAPKVGLAFLFCDCAVVRYSESVISRCCCASGILDIEM